MGELHILIVGDAVNGHRFIGPFYSYEEAADYAAAYERHDAWVVASVERRIDVA